MSHTKQTKIVATIGPASDSEENMTRLMELGVNVFRFNMKHNTVPWHEERIRRADTIAKSIGHNLGILVDLQGPEIRLETKDKKPVEVKKGQEVVFVDSLVSESDLLCLPHEIVFEVVKPGEELLIDDGFQEFDITKVEPGKIYAVAREDYTIGHRKGVNFPGKDITLSSLIDADLEKLEMAAHNKVDFIALSFCRSKSDIEILRSEMKSRNIDAAVVAKLESRQSLENLESILDATDAVMVARGDLGVEIPIEELAFWQKQIVYRCRQKYKPVIVATQMLQSMVDNPRPTRAEATDVANAVWDGTDAVMLSGESANGKYALKTVETMAKILKFNEPHSFVPELTPHTENSTENVVSAAMDIINTHTTNSPAAILVFTQSGYTARVVSSHRPHMPIIAVSNSPKTVEELSLSFGIKSVFAQYAEGEFTWPEDLIEKLKVDGSIKSGQTLLIIHGSHWKKDHATNSLALITV